MKQIGRNQLVFWCNNEIAIKSEVIPNQNQINITSNVDSNEWNIFWFKIDILCNVISLVILRSDKNWYQCESQLLLDTKRSQCFA